jgi:hypothetical protein
MNSFFFVLVYLLVFLLSLLFPCFFFLFISINKRCWINLIKDQVISPELYSFQFQSKVSKQQVVDPITLESCENSLQKWSQLPQHNDFLFH